jgi:hypothetical protein
LDFNFKIDTDTEKNCVQWYKRMIDMESLPFPDEIVLKILGYLNLRQLIQCARVSKRLNNICEDRSLSYRSKMLVMKELNKISKKRKKNWNSTPTLNFRSSMLEIQDLTVKDQKTILDTLIARPEVTEVIMSSKKTQQHLVHGKAPLHVMIFQNKLYFRWRPFDSELGYTLV